MKIIDRILLFIRHKNLSMRTFDKSINVGNGYTSKQYKSKGSVGSDVLEKIIDVYPDLNPLWLVTGDGKMILKKTTYDTDTEEKEQNNLSHESPLVTWNTSIDAMIETKIDKVVKRELKSLADKIDALPTLDQIKDEIQKTQQKDT